MSKPAVRKNAGWWPITGPEAPGLPWGNLETAQATGLTIGDAPADVLDGTIDELIKIWQRDWNRNPRIAELEALWQFCANPQVLIKTHGLKSARNETPESKAFAKDLERQTTHVEAAVKDWLRVLKASKALGLAAKDLQPGDTDKQKRELVKLLREDELVQAHLIKFYGSDAEGTPWLKPAGFRQAVMYALRDALLDGPALEKALATVKMYAAKGFLAKSIAHDQAPLAQEIPEAIRKWLPRTIVVETDPSGRISKITDRFANEHETLAVKIRRQHDIIRRYNEIVKRVKTDLKNGNELIRLCALITAIIMETGIRPGKEGNKVVKTVDGAEIDIETFGATTLGPSHVRFIRIDYAELEFVGKKASINIAKLKDAQIVQLLRQQVDAVKAGGGNLIFVTKEGKKVGYAELNKYFRTSLGDLDITDFRKLKATETVLDSLRAQQKDLRDRVQAFTTKSTAELQDQIANEVAGVIETALKAAQEALSHDNVDTTIANYVNPEVILRFLSESRVSDTIKEAVLSARPLLRFDPLSFLQSEPLARQQTAAVRKASWTLGDLLTDLDEHLEVQ